jgi:hypothetical protein
MNTNLALLLCSFRIFYLIFSSEKYWKKLGGSWDSYGCCFVCCYSLFFGQISVATTQFKFSYLIGYKLMVSSRFGFLLDQLSLWLFVTGIL